MRPTRELLAVILFAWVTVLVTRRTIRAGHILKRILAPVAVIAMVRAAMLAGYFIARKADPGTGFADAMGWLYMLSLPMVTLAFVGGLVAHRLFVAGAIEQLARALSAMPGTRALRAALSGALRDPALEVLYWVPEGGGSWIDADGRPAAPPRDGPGRAVTEVGAHGTPLASIVHDEEISRDRTLLQAVTTHVVTALENRQLVGQLRASLDELSESRARIVTAADDERRKIERDLHDGAQQRLVALQIKLELVAEKLDSESPEGAERIRVLRGEVATALDEMRRFAHGLYPAVLADRGLRDALHAVARSAPLPTTVDVRLPHRYSREVESAVYFACLEALQNAGKHAGNATCVSIAVTGNGRLRFDVRDNGAGFDPTATPDGMGITSLRDRIGALGGTLEISSAPGKGTRVTGQIPVA